MLQSDATWIGKALAGLESSAISQLLNVGGATHAEEIINCIQKIKQRLPRMGYYVGLQGSTSFTPWLFHQLRQSFPVLQRYSGAL